MKAYALYGIFLVLVGFGFPAAEARPGGGHSSAGHSSSGFHSSSGSHHYGSYSSPSGYSYSGGNGRPMSRGEVLFFIVILILVIIIKRVQATQDAATTYSSSPTPVIRTRRQQDSSRQLALLRQGDPNFSGILFLDFVHSLYVKFYAYSTHPEFRYLSPFLSADLRRHFVSAGSWTISEVVINGIQWLEVNLNSAASESISLAIEADYTLDMQGQRSRYAVSERWRFERHKGLLSPEPEKMQSLVCPHCGAPAQFTDAGLCEHCARVFENGEAQWYLAQRVVLQTTALDTRDLVSYAEETGTAYPTVRQRDLPEIMQIFLQVHNLSEDWRLFWQPFVDDIVKPYFLTIYEHWSRRDWQGVRQLLSDRLFEANLFWQQLYVENNWFNRLDDLTIGEIEIVNIELDKFYEALTVRIFASCRDYTEDAQGHVVGGSKSKLRRYSEYWTFVRRSGTEKTKAPYSLDQCPQCGAPADNIGQTAVCGYCGAKVSTGAFSWVLFLIQQDETYAG